MTLSGKNLEDLFENAKETCPSADTYFNNVCRLTKSHCDIDYCPIMNFVAHFNAFLHKEQGAKCVM